MNRRIRAPILFSHRSIQQIANTDDVFLDYAKLEEAQHKAAKAKAKARAKASGRKRQRDDGGSAADVVNADPAVIAAAARVRAVYERATSKVPPVAEKRYWKRYVYVWIMYAVWEELQADGGSNADCPDVLFLLLFFFPSFFPVFSFVFLSLSLSLTYPFIAIVLAPHLVDSGQIPTVLVLSTRRAWVSFRTSSSHLARSGSSLQSWRGGK